MPALTYPIGEFEFDTALDKVGILVTVPIIVYTYFYGQSISRSTSSPNSPYHSPFDGTHCLCSLSKMVGVLTDHWGLRLGDVAS